MNTVQLAQGVYALQVEAKQGFIYPALILDGGKAMLVDTGFPETIESLRKAIEEIVPFSNLDAVLFTHHDIDHIGCVKEIKKELPHVRMMALTAEKPYLEGKLTPVKLEKLERNLEQLPDEMKAFYHSFRSAFANRTITVDQELSDGMTLPYCGGITVIHTPGHVPGHTCYYCRQDKILITGDALTLKEGRLDRPAPEHTLDMSLAIESLKKLAIYDIEHIIAYHGGVYHGGLASFVSAL